MEDSSTTKIIEHSYDLFFGSDSITFANNLAKMFGGANSSTTAARHLVQGNLLPLQQAMQEQLEKLKFVNNPQRVLSLSGQADESLPQRPSRE